MKIAKLQPWLVKAPGTFWGEFLFLEVRTDEGISGWLQQLRKGRVVPEIPHLLLLALQRM